MTETDVQQQPNGVPQEQETLQNTEQSLKELKIEESDVQKQNGSNEVNENETNEHDDKQHDITTDGYEQENSNGNPSKREYQSKAERLEKQMEIDSRSIFVGNISPDATAETLEAHFEACGEINRVTILYNKLTGAPKGYAYIEFQSAEAVEKALELKDSQLHGETINVAKKRTNVPGYNNKNYYGRKEWIYPGWQGGVVRQWYYPYATAYQGYKSNGIQMPPNGFYPQYQYISRPPQGSKMGYPRNNYRNNYKNNYNPKRGNYKGQKNGSQSTSSKEATPEGNGNQTVSSQKNSLENGESGAVITDGMSENNGNESVTQKEFA